MVSVIFFHDFEGYNGEVPADQMGLLFTKDEVREIVEILTTYLETFPDDLLQVERDAFFKKYFPERYGLSRKPTPVKVRKAVEGSVYLMKSLEGYKIGIAKDPLSRLNSIRTSAPSIEMIHTFEADDYRMAEDLLHKEFQTKHINGEWFDLSDSEVEDIKFISGFKNEKFIKEQI